MNRKFVLSLLIVALCGNVFSQELKIRVGGNYGKFVKESTQEVESDLVKQLSNPNATDFSYNFEPGFDAEAMLFWTPNIETGLELKYSGFSGTNDVPPYYNYYFSADKPDNLIIITTKPQAVKSSALSFLFNFRYYVIADGKFSPYLKAFGGLSSVAAEYNYKDLSVWKEGEPGILYSAGTKDSSNPKQSAMHYGAGLGFNVGVTDKVSVYIDGTASFIKSDIIDGIPDYNYNSSNQNYERIGNSSLIYQVSLGIVFDTGVNFGLNKANGNKKGKGIKRSGRTTPYRPFYRQK